MSKLSPMFQNSIKNVVRWLQLNEQQYESSECQPEARNSDEQKCSEHGRRVDRDLDEERAVGK